MTGLAHANATGLPPALWLLLTMILTRGTVLFLLAYSISRAFRGLRPGFRHTLWFVVICGFLALPAARWVFPVISFDLHGHAPASGILLAPLIYRESFEAAMAGAGPVATAKASAGAWRALGAAVWVCYVGGFLSCAIRPIIARRALNRLCTCARRPAKLARAAVPLARRLCLRRPFTVLVHARVSIPFTYGFLVPRIILPIVSLSWPKSRLSAVLSHELAHIKRADSLLDGIAYTVCSLLWFVPLLWISRSLMRWDAELSCDLNVVEQGFPRTEYASVVLEFAAQYGRGLLLTAHSFLGNRNALERRIRGILTPRRRAPGRPSNIFRIAAMSLCIIVPLTLAGLTLGQKKGLFGTWLNRGREGPALYTWSDDGIGKRYARSFVAAGDIGAGGKSESLLIDLGAFFVEQKWTGPRGEAWYKVKTLWRSQGAPRYALIRVDPSGDSYESDESLDGYPASLDGQSGTGMHHRYERQ